MKHLFATYLRNADEEASSIGAGFDGPTDSQVPTNPTEELNAATTAEAGNQELATESISPYITKHNRAEGARPEHGRQALKNNGGVWSLDTFNKEDEASILSWEEWIYLDDILQRVLL